MCFNISISVFTFNFNTVDICLQNAWSHCENVCNLRCGNVFSFPSVTTNKQQKEKKLRKKLLHFIPNHFLTGTKFRQKTEKIS